MACHATLRLGGHSRNGYHVSIPRSVTKRRVGTLRLALRSRAPILGLCRHCAYILVPGPRRRTRSLVRSRQLFAEAILLGSCTAVAMPAAPQSIIDTRRHQMFPVLESADIERVRRFGKVRFYRAGEALVQV